MSDASSYYGEPSPEYEDEAMTESPKVPGELSEDDWDREAAPQDFEPEAEMLNYSGPDDMPRYAEAAAVLEAQANVEEKKAALTGERSSMWEKKYRDEQEIVDAERERYAKLEAALEYAKAWGARFADERDKLEAENARLREELMATSRELRKHAK